MLQRNRASQHTTFQKVGECHITVKYVEHSVDSVISYMTMDDIIDVHDNEYYQTNKYNKFALLTNTWENWYTRLLVLVPALVEDTVYECRWKPDRRGRDVHKSHFWHTGSRRCSYRRPCISHRSCPSKSRSRLHCTYKPKIRLCVAIGKRA